MVKIFIKSNELFRRVLQKEANLLVARNFLGKEKIVLKDATGKIRKTFLASNINKTRAQFGKIFKLSFENVFSLTYVYHTKTVV